MAVVWKPGIGWVDEAAKAVRVGEYWVNDQGSVYDSNTGQTMNISQLPASAQAIANTGLLKAREWLGTTPTPAPEQRYPGLENMPTIINTDPSTIQDRIDRITSRNQDPGIVLPKQEPAKEIPPGTPNTNLVKEIPVPIPAPRETKTVPVPIQIGPEVSANKFINSIANWAQLNELDPSTVAERLISNYESQAGQRFNQPYRDFMRGRASDTYGLQTLMSLFSPEDEQRNFAKGLGNYYESGTGGEVDWDRGSYGKDLLSRVADLLARPDTELNANQKIFRGDSAAQLAAIGSGLRGSVAPTLRGRLDDVLNEQYRRYRSQGPTGPATFVQFARGLGNF